MPPDFIIRIQTLFLVNSSNVSMVLSGPKIKVYIGIGVFPKPPYDKEEIFALGGANPGFNFFGGGSGEFQGTPPYLCMKP